jgi:hypothetical protein
MTHEVIKHLLDDYVTGDLTEDARGPVAEHIGVRSVQERDRESASDRRPRAGASAIGRATG